MEQAAEQRIAQAGGFDLEEFWEGSPMRVLQGFGAESLNRARVMCANEEIPASQRRLAARGVSFPDAAEYCPAVLETVAVREQSGTMYATDAASRGLSMTGTEMWALVSVHADAGHDAVLLPDGTRKPISNASAVDAGFFDGWMRPGEPITRIEQAGATAHDVDAVIAACYNPAIQMNNAHCQDAAQFLGQRFYREQQLAER